MVLPLTSFPSNAAYISILYIKQDAHPSVVACFMYVDGCACGQQLTTLKPCRWSVKHYPTPCSCVPTLCLLSTPLHTSHTPTHLSNRR